MAWHDGPKSRPNPLVGAYIADHPECQRVRDIVLEYDFVTEGIAWGVPFWFIDRAKAGFSQEEGPWGPLAYVSAAKTHITIGIAKGVEVQDRFGLLTGTGKSPIRKCVWKHGTAFPEEAVRDWVGQGVELER